MITPCCEGFADRIRDPLELGITISEGVVGRTPVAFLQMRACERVVVERLATAIQNGTVSLEGNICLSTQVVIQFCPFCGTRINIHEDIKEEA